MPWPANPSNLEADFTDDTLQATVHSAAHNATAAAINNIETVLSAGGITAAMLGTGIVTAAKLAANAATGAALGTDVVTTTTTAGGSLAGAYPSPTIAASAVGNAALATNAVTTTKITDGSVSSAKLASAAATGAKLGTDVRQWKAVNVNRVRFKESQDFFVHGVNMPWVNFGNDFGGGSSTGISNATQATTAGGYLSSMAAAGMNAVRWWMFSEPTNLNDGNRGAGTSVGTVSAGAYSGGGVITYTLGSGSTSGLTARQSYVTVTGASPTGYNVSKVLVNSIADSTHFTVGNQFSNPGSYVSGGTVTTGPDAWSNHYFLLDSAGYPIGIQPNVLLDMDAALVLLKARNIRAVFSLFRFPTDLPQTVFWNDARGQRALMDTLNILFSRYRDHPNILSWELGNEWGSYIVPTFWPKVNPDAAKKIITMFTGQVHATCRQTLASLTVGSTTDVQYVTGLGLDFLGASWYYSNGGAYVGGVNDPTLHNYAYYATNYGLDVPLIISECEVGANTGHSPSNGLTNTADATARYNTLYTNGFAGAWGWSVTDDASVGDVIDFTAATNFAAGKTDLGPSPSA